MESLTLFKHSALHPGKNNRKTIFSTLYRKTSLHCLCYNLQKHKRSFQLSLSYNNKLYTHAKNTDISVKSIFCPNCILEQFCQKVVTSFERWCRPMLHLSQHFGGEGKDAELFCTMRIKATLS